ncbi:hypothetical protein LCGC14_1735000 [marine sediment metagenome]|uniref:Uncharacterized protein n=1 Tax=marine sediment metagenome TaxID=412755 RepID=A0A0F9HW16_9ZZZZ
MSVNEKSKQVIEDKKPEVVLPAEIKLNKKEVKKCVVAVDMTPQDVLQLDTEGYDLFFDEDPVKFLELPPEIFKTLSKINKDRYAVSFTLNRQVKKERANPPSGVIISGRLATATARLEVHGGSEDMHTCWFRPDQHRQKVYEGYKVVDDEEVETFGGDVGSTHTVGIKGDTELILMEIPKKEFEKRQEDLATASHRRGEVEQLATRERLASEHGKDAVKNPELFTSEEGREVIRKRG